MEFMKKVETKRRFLGRVSHGMDLLDAITAFCCERDLHLGRVMAIGAVQRARLGFYRQDTHEYEYIDIGEPMEIATLIGNISVKDGKPFPHIHVTLADREGRIVGGHLATGTITFACEVMVEEWYGPAFTRVPDATTGLSLWEEPIL